MRIYVGGVNAVGKSTLLKKVSERLGYEYVHVTSDSRTRRRRKKKEEEEEEEEKKTSTIATVLFVDCHRMPFSGHCWLTKIDFYKFDLLTKIANLSQ